MVMKLMYEEGEGKTISGPSTSNIVNVLTLKI